jgi:hypothetical protein
MNTGEFADPGEHANRPDGLEKKPTPHQHPLDPQTLLLHQNQMIPVSSLCLFVGGNSLLA